MGSNIIVGTKCEEQKKRQVTQEKASNYASQHVLSFMELPAKSGANVKDIFNTLALEMRGRLGPQASTRFEKTDNGDRLQGGKYKNQNDCDGNVDVPA